MAEPLRVDIWSDIACPWCYVGKRRFAEGLRRYQEAGGARPVEVEYHSFELAPDTPTDFDGSHADYLAQRRGLSREQADQMLERMTQIAAGEGLEFHYESLRHARTLKAHELLHLAKAYGRQDQMKERLLSAYFTEGRQLGDVEELADLADSVGLDRAEVVAALSAGTYAPDVEADIAQARAYGINGVPFYVIDGRYGVSGAQAPETFMRALQEASADGVLA